MKRIVTFLSFGALGIALFGCPIYSDSGDYRLCDQSGCYRCPDNRYSSRCTPWGCGDDIDCPSGYSCTQNQCVPGGGSKCARPEDCPKGSYCAPDGTCRVGDCSTTGCSTGYVCKVQMGAAMCVPNGAGDGGTNMDAGPPPECSSDSTCVQSKGQGAKCLNGTCVAAQDLCVDKTQCKNDFQCVDGVCTPPCDMNKPCPTGYSCDLQKGVCTGNPNPCTTSAQCMGGNVCVQGRCVPPCGGGCMTGFVCVGGGCVPDQKAQFVCNKEGVQDVCKMGSLCLRHNCYIACDIDASMSCQNADQFKVCKAVTTMSGTYSVCGSNTNLGSECDPSLGKNCTNNGICIDGYCR